MPRKDRRWTANDIIRVIESNLDSKEVAKVVLHLCSDVNILELDGESVLVPLLSEEEGIVPTNLVLDLLLGFRGVIVDKLPGLLGDVIGGLAVSKASEVAIERELIPWFDERR